MLLVEDEAALRDLMVRLLTRAGYAVVAAGNAAEAEAAFGANADGFAAAAVDLTLPDGPGDRLLNGFREASPSLPLVAISGMALPSERYALGEGEAAYCLMKPFLPRALVELLDRIADQSPASSAC